MDSPVEEIQYTKATPSSNQDGTKKKKSTRKKPEAKPPKTVDLEVPEIPADPNQDINTDLIQHAYKLEHELAVTKKKLKNQRRKFRQLIYSLAKYIDAKGITANVVDEYVRGIRPQLADDQDSENDYDKFYSTYKYVVIDEHSQHNGKIVTTNGHKTVSKPSSNMLKGSTTDHPTTDQDAIVITADAPQETAAQTKTTKGGRPKKDPATKEAKANGEEPKKRKTKKQKEGEDRKGSVEAIDLEEIPNPTSATKPKNDFQIPALDENSNSNSNSRGMMRPNIPNLDPTEIMKAMMMNPGLGMNIPGMGILPGLQGMQISENDMAMFSKAMEEMAKGAYGNILGGADMMNFYPGNFK